ncbi:TM2 domain-containing protein [Frankia sp. QA3]|uniref:TM2 domain-containing protein n=1 Tax=Frankia sp. QA3 TaxID=710111 RepID=UPI000269BBF1|nr:TM2 domain-containing protein [Frankia sp. QA3]EIV92194.1 hypothetical protein FraQA3DRAFT_1722 [Frankia sp. QA3]
MTQWDDPRARSGGPDPYDPQAPHGQPPASYGPSAPGSPSPYGPSAPHGPLEGAPAAAPQGYYDPYAQPGPAGGPGPGGPGAPWAGQPYGGAYPPPGGPYPMGAPQPFPGPGPLAPPKSVAVALLLTFLWLGAGHLYAGRIATGATLLIVNLFLWMLSFFIITLILTVPVWLILWVIAMITSATAVNNYNARIGYPRV